MNITDISTEVQRRIFGISVDDLRKLVADSRNELADLKVVLNNLEREVQALRTELTATKVEKLIEDMTLDEVLALHKGSHDALERFEIHGGGPRTLREAVANIQDADLLTIVATIKNLLKDKAA